MNFRCMVKTDVSTHRWDAMPPGFIFKFYAERRIIRDVDM